MYDSTKRYITLSGSKNDAHLELEETVDERGVTGSFSLDLAANDLRGTWLSPDKKRTVNVVLQRVHRRPGDPISFVDVRLRDCQYDTESRKQEVGFETDALQKLMGKINASDYATPKDCAESDNAGGHETASAKEEVTYNRDDIFSYMHRGGTFSSTGHHQIAYATTVTVPSLETIELYDCVIDREKLTALLTPIRPEFPETSNWEQFAGFEDGTHRSGYTVDDHGIDILMSTRDFGSLQYETATVSWRDLLPLLARNCPLRRIALNAMESKNATPLDAGKF